MVNPFLIIVTVILSFAIILGCIYILVYFQHPEDKLVAWGPKIVVVVGLALACFSVLMLPLDVANRNSDGGFPMATLWLIVYIVLAVMAVVVVPFAMFYYEGDEYDETGEAPSQLGSAIKGTLITFIVFAVVTVVLYLFVGVAEIPVVVLHGTLITTVNRSVPHPLTDNVTIPEVPYSCINYTALVNRTVTVNETNSNNETISVNQTITLNVTLNETCFYFDANDTDVLYAPDRTRSQIEFRVTIFLFIISIVVFFGWLLFILFGGVGLVALPLDCINNWRSRPVRIPLDKYLTRKKEIGERATKLIEKGKAIQDKQRRGKERKKDRKNYNKFRLAVFLLEEDYEKLQECYKRQGGKLILYFLSLCFGVIGVGLTIVWLLHIILYVFTYPYPFSPFLNTMVIELDEAFGLLGTVAYGIFSFYLLLCCIKGNFKFGMRVFFLFPIHPMRVNGTLMNAFLFNTGLIIICSFSVTQFCTTAFADYTTDTAISGLFALSVRNLKGLKYIFLGYNYVLFAMVFLTGIFFAVKRTKRQTADDILV